MPVRGGRASATTRSMPAPNSLSAGHAGEFSQRLLQLCVQSIDGFTLWTASRFLLAHKRSCSAVCRSRVTTGVSSPSTSVYVAENSRASSRVLKFSMTPTIQSDHGMAAQCVISWILHNSKKGDARVTPGLDKTRRLGSRAQDGTCRNGVGIGASAPKSDSQLGQERR